MTDDPLARFQALFTEARAKETADPTAMALATADADGAPSVRMVLLKGADASGFVFYTNLDSRKARELGANPRAALCIHWTVLGVQVRVEGRVEQVTEGESDAYFASRPRESQLGAWASRQSEPLGSREELLDAYLQKEALFSGRDVPRPPRWGGFRVVPVRIEFWESKEHRLHDRMLYVRSGEGWTMQRLWP